MGKLISSEVKYDGPRFNVVQKIFEREDGKKIVRDIVNPGDAAVVLPITENNEIVFVSQLREAIGKVSVELPAGMVDPGEEPIQTARRELEEETGLIAKNIEHMISLYPSTGYTSEQVHIFLARDFEQGHVQLDATEQILDVIKVPVEECIERVKNGKLENATQIIAILLYAAKFMK
jgi:ADP-ribose pyrophosphatase